VHIVQAVRMHFLFMFFLKCMGFVLGFNIFVEAMLYLIIVYFMNVMKIW